jgi:hypothetical protein
LSDVQVLNKTAYVGDTSDGWLVVKINGGNYSIPMGLKVKLIEERDERIYFVIQEGSYKGKNASVRSGQFFTEHRLTLSGAELEFDLTTERLTVKGLGSYNAITYSSNPVPKGSHNIELPDAPHQLGSVYTTYSPYATTWFRIGQSGDRYLHPGRISAGCVTVTDLREWTDIYEYLIYRRSSDYCVGTLTVKETKYRV